jgi:hypothetical protein
MGTDISEKYARFVGAFLILKRKTGKRWLHEIYI